jgi:hypothetical protein
VLHRGEHAAGRDDQVASLTERGQGKGAHNQSSGTMRVARPFVRPTPYPKRNVLNTENEASARATSHPSATLLLPGPPRKPTFVQAHKDTPKRALGARGEQG